MGWKVLFELEVRKGFHIFVDLIAGKDYLRIMYGLGIPEYDCPTFIEWIDI